MRSESPDHEDYSAARALVDRTREVADKARITTPEADRAGESCDRTNATTNVDDINARGVSAFKVKTATQKAAEARVNIA